MIATRTHQTLSRLITHPPNVSLIPEGMGSSGTRTAEQKTIAGAHADNLLQAIPDRTPVIFTDGSALGNPGACGVASVCYPTGLSDQPIILNKPLSSRSTSYHRELFALRLAVEICIDWHKTPVKSIFSLIVNWSFLVSLLLISTDRIRMSWMTYTPSGSKHGTDQALVVPYFNISQQCLKENTNPHYPRIMKQDSKRA